MFRFRTFIIILVAATAGLPGHSVAQTVIGTIVNTATQQPIPFVNVGLPKRGLGTVSDEQGHYQLAYNPAYAADTVRISSVGFQAKLLPFAALLAGPGIGLVPAEVQLAEVSVTAAGTYRQQHTVGLAKPSPSFDFHMISNELGTEIGTLIHLERRPALLQTVHVAVVKNEAGALTFRLNLYRLGPNGQPTTEKLLPHDVLVTATPQAGILSADLSAEHLVLNEDFVLALEWVKSPTPTAPDVTKRISFGGAMKYGGQLYFRNASQAAWVKPTFSSNVPMLGKRPTVALYATVKD
jgi:hypothetical protein